MRPWGLLLAVALLGTAPACAGTADPYALIAGVTAGLAALTGGSPLDPLAEEGISALKANLTLPGGLAVDAAGNLFIGDIGTVGVPLLGQLATPALVSLTKSLPPIYAHVKKVTPAGIITTVAGPGTRFFPDPKADDGLELPLGIAVAKDGRMAIVDGGANLVRILPAGSY